MGETLAALEIFLVEGLPAAMVLLLMEGLQLKCCFEIVEELLAFWRA
jgi:hypothetical protein